MIALLVSMLLSLAPLSENCVAGESIQFEDGSQRLTQASDSVISCAYQVTEKSTGEPVAAIFRRAELSGNRVYITVLTYAYGYPFPESVHLRTVKIVRINHAQ